MSDQIIRHSHGGKLFLLERDEPYGLGEFAGVKFNRFVCTGCKASTWVEVRGLDTPVTEHSELVMEPDDLDELAKDAGVNWSVHQDDSVRTLNEPNKFPICRACNGEGEQHAIGDGSYNGGSWMCEDCGGSGLGPVDAALKEGEPEQYVESPIGFSYNEAGVLVITYEPSWEDVARRFLSPAQKACPVCNGEADRFISSSRRRPARKHNVDVDVVLDDVAKKDVRLQDFQDEAKKLAEGLGLGHAVVREGGQPKWYRPDATSPWEEVKLDPQPYEIDEYDPPRRFSRSELWADDNDLRWNLANFRPRPEYSQAKELYS